MQHLRFDYVVVGSGPAGQKGVIQAAKLGKKVVVIEEQPHLGGNSLNWGTIPSKSLREAILDLTGFHPNWQSFLPVLLGLGGNSALPNIFKLKSRLCKFVSR